MVIWTLVSMRGSSLLILWDIFLAISLSVALSLKPWHWDCFVHNKNGQSKIKKNKAKPVKLSSINIFIYLFL